MNASETLAHALLGELRRFAGEAPLTARIAPMQWVAIAKEVGLSDKARGEAITYLRTKGYIAYKPETTEILGFSPAGIEAADQLIRERPKVSDPMPSTLEAICAELDYWELHLNDGEVGSNDWVKVRERIDGLRHRENRFRPSVSITNNAIGSNPRINLSSLDKSTNVADTRAESPTANRNSESDLREPRFRREGDALGVFWSRIPPYIKKAPASEIRLATGPSMWLRLIPETHSPVDLSLPKLLGNVLSDGKLWLSPLNWEDIGYLRAEDGFGVYARLTEADTKTNSVAFVFETGEIWSIDTGLLYQTSALPEVFFEDVRKAMCTRLPHYSQFIKSLGVKPPFQWIAGLDGIKRRRLNVYRPREGVSGLGEVFLTDRITCSGSYDGAQEPHLGLAPFFREVFKRSSMEYPNYLQNLRPNHEKR